MENDASIAQICLITGLDPEEAVNALQLADGNIETAIQMFFDGLLETSDTNIVNEPSSTSETSHSDPSNEFYDSVHDLWDVTSETAALQALNERVMFQVDPQLPFNGNFTNAITFAKDSNKWLLVNIQNVSQFPCHCLNRDVWNNPIVSNIIRGHFVFFQTYNELRVGGYLNSLYNQEREYPFVAVIDPRTREMVKRIKQFMCDDVVSVLYDFIEMSPRPVEVTMEVEEPLHRRLMSVESDEEDIFNDATYKLVLPDNKEEIVVMDYGRPVRHLLKVVSRLGYGIDSFKVTTTFPPIDITKLEDYNISLKDAGLQRRQKIVVASKD